MAKPQTEKFSSASININKYAYDKNEVGRYSQLAAFFHMLKSDLGQNTYCEFALKDGSIYIPYSFNLYETSVYATHFYPEMMYIEIDQDNYVEITFDTIEIHGTPELISLAKKVFKEAESFRTIIPYYSFDYKTYANWLWQKFLQSAYEKCMEIGNQIFKNGNFMVYPVEEYEYYVITKEDFNKTPINNMDYIVIRSNIQMEKMLIIDIARGISFATGFDELEQLKLADFLKPSA
jgi:hypothetical protein